MAAATRIPNRVYLDLTHLGRHVTGIERVSIEQFEKVDFESADVIPVRSSGIASMILRQQFQLPWLAITHPKALFVFPGFPPSPLFALFRRRAILYVHDTFLNTRRQDLGAKARLYMAPSFALAVRTFKNFFVNSEKTKADLAIHARPDANLRLYRPSVANVFNLETSSRTTGDDAALPLKLVALGTVEPRKNYAAALAILDSLRAKHDPAAELHIVGRAGWGPDAEQINSHAGVTVHGYLPEADVRRVMASTDVYLCTSHDEGLGLPLLEAQYAGLPVVAPDKPVFREVLASSGTFIDPALPDQAAATIAALISKPDWRGAASKAALENVARWNALAASDLEQARRIFLNWETSAADNALSPASAQ